MVSLLHRATIIKQDSRRSHFARAVHSHHPIPGRSNLRPPNCPVPLMDWVPHLSHGTYHRPKRHLDRFSRFCMGPNWYAVYDALSVGKKTPKTAPSKWDFVTLPEKDRVTRTWPCNMCRKISKDRECCSWDIVADRQTDILITIPRQRSCGRIN